MRKLWNARMDPHAQKKWLSIWVKAFIAQYYLIVLNCVWKSRSQDDRILEVKDVWGKVEEEDQVIYDCYSIPSNQLIALLPFLYPAVNTLSQLLTLYYSSSSLLTPLFICFFSISRFASLVSFHVTFAFLQVPKTSKQQWLLWSQGARTDQKEALKQQQPCLINRH